MDLIGANAQNFKTVPITTQELVRDCLLGGYLDGFIQNGNVAGENVNESADGTNDHTGSVSEAHSSSHGNDGTDSANNAGIGKNATDDANNAENKAEGAVVAGA